jgi:hypothetical protein
MVQALALLPCQMESCMIDRCAISVRVPVGRDHLSAMFSSLVAFIAAGIRPPTPLARAIVLVLVRKLIGIAGIKFLMFPDNAPIDAVEMARALGPPASSR